MAPGAPSEQWPPRSPHEALVSTPKGREKYRLMLDQTSPSASPTRVAGASRALSRITGSAPMEGDDDGDEDEDEETLQLKLQEIQARLRLKKLQSAKGKEPRSTPGDGLPPSKSEPTLGRSRSLRATTPDAAEQRRPVQEQNPIQVPASPVRKAQAVLDPTSPRRVQLGIDKGLTARDISLKRAPSSKKIGYLRTSRTAETMNTNPAPARSSFSDRLANARTEEVASAQRRMRIQQSRSNGFGISKNEMESFKTSAVDITEDPFAVPSFSREEIMLGSGSRQEGHSKPDVKTNTSRPEAIPPSSTFPSIHNNTQSLSSQQTTTRVPGVKKPTPGEVPEQEATSFEPYSKLHLKRRVLPHQVLVRQITDKRVYSMKDLLKVVKAPEYSLPEVEQDVVLFGIVAKKSEPKAHKPLPAKNGMKQEERGKFMIITLVDLEWEIELFLFNTGFTRFWKLTEGTVVAILNPGIMPPPPGRSLSGKFSLVISSDADTILEIGVARDLGFCQSVKRDGQLCSAWVNWKRTHFCEFHSNQALDKKKKSRVEMNSAGFGARKHNQREAYRGPERRTRSNQTYDRESGTHFFASSRSAADLIDGKDQGLADQREKAENLKRKLAAQEKEMDIVKKLTRVGTGAGKEYMETAAKRARAAAAAAAQGQGGLLELEDEPEEEKPDAAALGLLSSKGHKIHLSPVKRKRRPESSQAGSTMSSTSRPSYGWGSNLKDKLAKMKAGEKLRGEHEPPERKKTRFVTEKGIREAGRESLGGELSEKMVDLDDDDDLVIVR